MKIMIAQYIYHNYTHTGTRPNETEESDGHRIDDWMLICQHNAEFGQATGEEEDCDWSLAARAYPELREMPSYIAQQRQEFVAQSALTTTAHASHLQGKQLQAYTDPQPYTHVTTLYTQHVHSKSPHKDACTPHTSHYRQPHTKMNNLPQSKVSSSLESGITSPSWKRSGSSLSLSSSSTELNKIITSHEWYHIIKTLLTLSLLDFS